MTDQVTQKTNDELYPWEIFVCATNGVFAKVIDKVTDGNENHAYISVPAGFWPGTEGPGSLGMEPGGLTWRPAGYWGPNNPHSQFKLDTRGVERLKHFLIAHKKAKYDYAGDVLVGFDDLTKQFLDPFFHVLEHIEDEVSPFWFCSAFADAAFTFAGVTVIEGRKHWEEHGVTPEDLYRQCFVARGWEPNDMDLTTAASAPAVDAGTPMTGPAVDAAPATPVANQISNAGQPEAVTQNDGSVGPDAGSTSGQQ